MTRGTEGVAGAAKPDLTGTLVILLFSAAITIFVLWIANQAIGNSVFGTLPDWVVGASKGIWTSMTTGAAGFGLAIAKSFGRRGGPQPDYLRYVGITTACLFLPITAIAALNFWIQGKYVATTIDPHVNLIDPKSTKEQEFELSNDPASPLVQYRLRGTYRVDGSLVKLHLTSGEISVAPYVQSPGTMQLQELSFWGCYLKHVGNHDEKTATSLAQKPSQSIDLDMPVVANAKKQLNPSDLSFEIPQGADLSRMWLCGGIRTNIGGYLPFQWS
jgi:hypothetical protein